MGTNLKAVIGLFIAMAISACGSSGGGGGSSDGGGGIVIPANYVEVDESCHSMPSVVAYSRMFINGANKTVDMYGSLADCNAGLNNYCWFDIDAGTSSGNCGYFHVDLAAPYPKADPDNVWFYYQ